MLSALRVVTPAVLSVVLLAACATAPQRNPLAQWRGSPNHDERRARVIVLHHTEMESAEAALHTLQTRNSGGPVSAHYLVGADGRLYQLVPESERAWHAGASRWGGIGDLNSDSIGIEIDNDGASPFPDAQIDTVIALLDDITTRLRIPRHLILAHADIAPTRKRDPSARFPWRRLAEAGFGLWPRTPLAPVPDGFDPWLALRLIGYDLSDPEAARCAFHRRYRGIECRVDGNVLAGAEADDRWLPGDREILHDLQRQLVAMPEGAP
ncbi:N-acetylmuramoyl-L-alanine amidase [Lysobacter sp. TLK-CK17T]|uniref:N-acetylmuramoyl-L-alanine amidase n=1 Tax=Marilutibacter chinensis TaxID=2912247 RepID=A0ABS9HR52_9GAMM|nr:N-acetylmuramoyl-L-alanine amidase [Lysobacter chinensis]MCF7221424.1 N-acetylmuramoyl-L-alanine amidase [Lysobacter chinensis]